MRSLSFLFVLSLSSACTVTINEGGGKQPSADPAAPTSNEGPDAVAPIEAEAAVPADPHAELPDCPASASQDVYCTEAGKLAGRWMMVDMVRVPADAEEIFAATPELDRQPSLHIAVVGEALYIRKVSCGSCARIMGEGFEGQLDALSEEQLRSLAARLGLGEARAPLSSAQAWREYAGGEGGEALSQLAAAAALE